MMRIKAAILSLAVALMMLTAGMQARPLWADSISPVEEQEFSDAKAALEAAKKAQGEQYAAPQINEARDFTEKADKARTGGDREAFTRASRLARAYADLARVLAELGADTDRLTAVTAELKSVKEEIEGLKKSQ